jgi:hypothetical protein
MLTGIINEDRHLSPVRVGWLAGYGRGQAHRYRR